MSVNETMKAMLVINLFIWSFFKLYIGENKPALLLMPLWYLQPIVSLLKSLLASRFLLPFWNAWEQTLRKDMGVVKQIQLLPKVLTRSSGMLTICWSATAYAFNAAGMKFFLNSWVYIDRPIMKEHMQYIIDHAGEIEKLLKVKAQVSEVKSLMLENIDKVYKYKPHLRTLFCAFCQFFFSCSNTYIHVHLHFL